jgi:uncharacterized repeat protein (TIGR03803 family)
MFGVLMMLATPGLAQTFTVLHTFTGGADGSTPNAGVTVGPSGVLYGTTPFGGTRGGDDCCGTVFKLNLVNSSWIFTPLYEFTGHNDGGAPYGGVTIGPNGALYGTTSQGGTDGLGAVFELRPSPTHCRSAFCYWNETVLHSFTGVPDGYFPEWVKLVFDQAGDFYGTTYGGGAYEYGTVFELTPSGGGYTESVIYSFDYPTTGTGPQSGVVLDTAGNLYGTTTYGGTGTRCMDNCGTVYQLVPSGGGWAENVLVNFQGGTGGGSPLSNPILDASGNVYGTAGVIYKLTPSGGGFTYRVLSTLNAGCGYQSALAIDAAGNLFGVCDQGPGAGGYGWVFELTNCSQTCTVIDLHDFSGGSDGAGPLGTPALDANGNLFGTAAQGAGGCNGGHSGCGTVWEVTGVGAPADPR